MSASETLQKAGSSGNDTGAATTSSSSGTDPEKSPPPQQTDNKDSSSVPSGNFPSGMVNFNSYNMQNYYWNMQNFGVQFPGQIRPGFNNNFPNSPMRPDHPPLPPGEDPAPLPPTPEDEPPPPPPPPNDVDELLSPPPPPPPPSDADYAADKVMEDADDGIEMEISDVEENASDQESSKSISISIFIYCDFTLLSYLYFDKDVQLMLFTVFQHRLHILFYVV